MGEELFNGGRGEEGFSKAFSEILSNPEMMSAISSLAKKFKASDTQEITPSAADTEKEEEKKEEKAEESKETSALVERLPEILGMLSSKNSGIEKNRRSELLCALKPYLSQSRTDAIDRIIKLSELSSVFKNLS